MNKRCQEVKKEKEWVCFKQNKRKSTMSVDSLTISNLQMLDERLRLFVPALFSEIKIIDNEVIVKVPLQAAPRVVNHLRLNYFVNATLKVIGV